MVDCCTRARRKIKNSFPNCKIHILLLAALCAFLTTGHLSLRCSVLHRNQTINEITLSWPPALTPNLSGFPSCIHKYIVCHTVCHKRRRFPF